MFIVSKYLPKMIEKIEEIRDYLYKYLEARLDLFKTEAQEQIENIVIQIIYLVVLLLLVSLTGIFVFIMLAVLLNEWLDSRYWGFAIVFGLLLIKTIVWIRAGDWVNNIVRRLLYHIFKKN
ncbi:MAG TPA: hypothetical protein DCR35_12590 [Runella sp.]|nr:hypothetical protein [Runella sp.]HAO50060.1 hypothetical protein [Runella sp.]